MSQSTAAVARGLGDRGWRLWFGHFEERETGMAGGGKDIDPATELADDDEEQALPERDDLSIEPGEAMLSGTTGPLAAGRAVLLRHAKLAPSSPGVNRMLDAAGEVLYVGKAKSIKKRFTSY